MGLFLHTIAIYLTMLNLVFHQRIFNNIMDVIDRVEMKMSMKSAS